MSTFHSLIYLLVFFLFLFFCYLRHLLATTFKFQRLCNASISFLPNINRTRDALKLLFHSFCFVLYFLPNEISLNSNCSRNNTLFWNYLFKWAGMNKFDQYCLTLLPMALVYYFEITFLSYSQIL